jgi:hypothetical protein
MRDGMSIEENPQTLSGPTDSSSGIELYSGSLTFEAGSRLARKVLGFTSESNPFCVILPAISMRSIPARTFGELIERAKQSAKLEPDMSKPVVVSFFEGIGTNPENLEKFCATQDPPLSVEVFHQNYNSMPADVLNTIEFLDAVPERPICYRFSVAGIQSA